MRNYIELTGPAPATPTRTCPRYLREWSWEEDGLQLDEFPFLRDSAFQALEEEVYSAFQPGQHAKNALCRGIRWGILSTGGQISWLNRREYSLPADLNPEERGAVRVFDRIPEPFLRTREIETMLLDLFAKRGFSEPSDRRAYEIQLSAIRYEPTLSKPCMPSPVEPHQDLIDGSIVCLRKEQGLLGGQSRIYDLEGSPLYEYSLGAGEALSVQDDRYLHQVLPMMVHTANWRPGQRVCRDVLLVRFQPLGR